MFRLCHAVFLALLIFALPAHAQQTTGNYTVRALGVKVGDMVINGSVSASAYTVSAQFETSGLVGAVKGVRFLLSATGKRKGAQFYPKQYREDMNTGERESRTQLAYSNGIASATGSQIGDPGPYSVTDAQQKGAVDPLTGWFMVLRDQRSDEICNLTQKIFDGERLTQIQLGNPRSEGSVVVCSGAFQRIGGYAPDDLRSGKSFGLTVTYEATGDVMRLTKVRAETIYGPATIVRR
ncbi:DUF3108 domain-containing protein [Phaeobacter marinintestinus]|uniref:DUF3108 domain-containing protein n=1 Tax=Falsiphaeobacter marinintestinus TaxID=1492905 RepID=UPI0011B3C045|nr:DUF3108 domain-containing protein [Phaeobacter marinintestinus]